MEYVLLKKRRNRILAAAVLLLCMLPLLWIALYSRPSADDYDFSLITHEVMAQSGGLFGALSGAWQADIGRYYSWQGTYSASFLMALQPGIWGETYYFLTPVIILALVFLALWGAVHIFQRYLLEKPVVPAALAALFLTFYLAQQMPYPNQGLFWYNGGVYYTPFTVFVFLNLALMLKLYCTEKRAACVWLSAAASVLAFLISGGNNVSAFLNIILLFFACLLFVRKKRVSAVFPLAAALLGFLLVYVAPGTSVRKGAYGGQSLIGAGVVSLFQGAKTMMSWVTLGWLAFLVLMLPAAWAAARRNRLHLSFRWPLLPLAMTYFLISAMWFMPRYVVGNFGAPRLTDAVWIAFVLFSFLDLIYLLGWVQNHVAFAQKLPAKPKKQTFVRLLAAAACLIAILGCGNRGNCEYGTSTEAIVEIGIGNAAAFAQQCDARLAAYHDETQDTVAVEPFTTTATLLYVSDIGSGEMDWAYPSISAYYGKTITAACDAEIE